MGLTIIQKPANPDNYSPSRQWNGTNYGVRLLVIHTEDGFEAGTDAWFANGNSHVSAHYSVAETGELHQHVIEGATAWHAGNWLVNLQSIGIEFEDLANPDHNVHADAQYEAGAQLIADICHRYQLACNRQTIIKHNEIPNPSHPDCPGDLDVDRLVTRAQQLLSGVVTAGVTTTPGWPQTITVELNALRVRTAPITNSAVVPQPTSDGLLHQGQTFVAVGLVAGQDVDYSASGGAHTNEWLHSSRNHYVWAGGTNFPWQTNHPTTAQEIPVTVVDKPVETVENSLPEWEETFVADTRTVRLKYPPAYAIDMTGMFPMQEINYPSIRVSGHFMVDGRKYWKGTGATRGFYGIKDEDVQETPDGHAISATRLGFGGAHTYRDPFGAVIRRLPFSGRDSNDNNNG